MGTVATEPTFTEEQLRGWADLKLVQRWDVDSDSWLIRDLARALLDAREEIETDDKLLADRNRILDAYPCAVHGPCVPHIMETLEEHRRLLKVGWALLLAFGDSESWAHTDDVKTAFKELRHLLGENK